MVPRTFALPIAAAAVVLLAGPAHAGVQTGGRTPDSTAASPTPTIVADSVSPAPIVIGPDTVGVLYGVSGVLTPAERRDAVVDRIQGLRLRRVPGDSVTVSSGPEGRIVRAAGTPVLAVTQGDADGLGVTPDSVLVVYAEAVRAALDVPIVRGTPAS